MYATPQPLLHGHRPPVSSGRVGRRPRTIGNYAGGLAAITADQAAQQAMPQSSIRNTPGFTQAVYNEIVSAAQSGQFTDYNAQATSCTRQSTGSKGAAILGIAGSGANLALTTAVHAGLIAAGPVTAGISIAIAGIVGLFGTILNHHAQAIAKENRILCASGPAANNYLQIIDQAVQNGQATPADAVNALQSLLADYKTAVAPIIKMSSSKCNAACVELKELTAIVAYKTAAYQDLAATQAAQPGGSIAASLGIPTWALYAAGGVLLWKLL